MEKMIDETSHIINNNERLIANILHDIKSPLYSIKIALQNKLDCELHNDIFETTLDIIKYIENFLCEYSFKQGKFENKTAPCNIKEIITKKLDNYKYIFINKKIFIDICYNTNDFTINSIPVFLSSIIGNIVSNIAFHAPQNSNAKIELSKKQGYIVADFKNSYNSSLEENSLGLDFCANLAQALGAEFKLTKTKKEVCASLKIPNLKA